MSKQKENATGMHGGSGAREHGRSREARAAASSGIPISPKKPVECSIPEDLAAVLSPKAFGQLFSYAYATDMEVCLLGIVKREGSVFRVCEFFLVTQTGSSAHTELDPAAVGQLVERLLAEGRADDVRKIRCWAHSHPRMDVFWSKTDDETCKLLAADWLLSVVVSEGFKIRARLDVSSPVPFTLDHLAVHLESPIDAATVDQCRLEVQEKLKPMPMFETFGTDRRRDKDAKPGDRSVEMVDYCELCGSWHEDGACPMEGEMGYELAQQESALRKDDPREDDVWF